MGLLPITFLAVMVMTVIALNSSTSSEFSEHVQACPTATSPHNHPSLCPFTGQLNRKD